MGAGVAHGEGPSRFRSPYEQRHVEEERRGGPGPLHLAAAQGRVQKL